MEMDSYAQPAVNPIKDILSLKELINAKFLQSALVQIRSKYSIVVF